MPAQPLRPVKLLPVSKRMKQIIAGLGDEWWTNRDPEPMQCFNGDLGVFIWTAGHESERNVRLTDIED